LADKISGRPNRGRASLEAAYTPQVLANYS